MDFKVIEGGTFIDYVRQTSVSTETIRVFRKGSVMGFITFPSEVEGYICTSDNPIPFAMDYSQLTGILRDAERRFRENDVLTNRGSDVSEK